MATSILLKCVVILLIITLALHLAGFSTDNWSTSDLIKRRLSIDLSTRAGLWIRCYCLAQNSCVCKPYDEEFSGFDILTQALLRLATGTENEVWFQAVRAMECLGIIGLVLTLVFLVIVAACVNKSIVFRVLAVITLFVTGIAIAAGVIAYGSFMSPNVFGYSFALCAAAAGLSFITGIILIVEIIRERQLASQTDRHNNRIQSRRTKAAFKPNNVQMAPQHRQMGYRNDVMTTQTAPNHWQHHDITSDYVRTIQDRRYM